MRSVVMKGNEGLQPPNCPPISTATTMLPGAREVANRSEIMSAKNGEGLKLRIRLAIGSGAYKVRRQIGRIDNPEVRRARGLSRVARTKPIDILQLGDSVVSWIAPYDSDRRPISRMLKDSFGPEVRMHSVHAGSYNPLIFNQFVRMLEGHSARPLVILPLSIRASVLTLTEHPAYNHKRASQFLSTVTAATPLRKIRAGFPPPTQSDFEQFHTLKFPTWAGDLTVGDYIRGLKRNDLSEDEAARLLYAYLHGGQVVQGAPLNTVRELGDRLRRLGVPVVAYETPVPVEKGIELFGSEFYELAKRNFDVLEDAFVSGYGDLPIVRTGLSMPTSHFIDWHDASEHLNEHGRSAITAAVVEAAMALRS